MPEFVDIAGRHYEVLVATPPTWDRTVDAHVCHRTRRVYINPSVPSACRASVIRQARREACRLVYRLHSAAA